MQLGRLHAIAVPRFPGSGSRIGRGSALTSTRCCFRASSSASPWRLFDSFRIMVAIGMAMLGLSLWSLYLRWRGTLYTNRWFLNAAMLMTPSGFGAVLFGWFTAEIGRQPYIVYGQLRTADAHAPLTVNAVTTSLVAFLIAYAFIFGFGSYDLAKLLRKGPAPLEEAMRGDDIARTPKRPLSAVDESLTPAKGRVPA
nr:cytochrome ubiquinol oxidase subunit I [Methylobacterium goesingense]